jgi:hypothetical protein
MVRRNVDAVDLFVDNTPVLEFMHMDLHRSLFNLLSAHTCPCAGEGMSMAMGGDAHGVHPSKPPGFRRKKASCIHDASKPQLADKPKMKGELAYALCAQQALHEFAMTSPNHCLT